MQRSMVAVYDLLVLYLQLSLGIGRYLVLIWSDCGYAVQMREVFPELQIVTYLDNWQRAFTRFGRSSVIIG